MEKVQSFESACGSEGAPEACGAYYKLGFDVSMRRGEWDRADRFGLFRPAQSLLERGDPRVFSDRVLSGSGFRHALRSRRYRPKGGRAKANPMKRQNRTRQGAVRLERA